MPEEPTPKPDRLTYWIDLAKWLIVSVGLVIMTTIIDTGFKDRAAGIVEMNAHDKYVTDLIVLNEKVGPRRLLAQYFAHVTASTKLQPGWARYYHVVDSEYRAIATRDTLIAIKEQGVLSKAAWSKADSVDLERWQEERRVIKDELNAPLRVIEQPVVRPSDAASAAVWERKGYEQLAQRDAQGAIEAFEKAEQSFSDYHSAREIARYLKQNEDLALKEDTAVWNAAIAHINRNFSWRVPKGTKDLLRTPVKR